MADLKLKEAVSGYKFESLDAERDGTICQIIRRAGTDDEQVEEPHFLVEFSDGVQMVALASELRPWYMT